MHEFNDLVGRLTREHPVTVPTDDGPKFIRVPGLLQQLRDELFGGSDTGTVVGNRAKLPLNAPALDLYELIDRQISEVWGAAFNRVPSTDRPEALLAQWAALVGEEGHVTYSTPETVMNPLERVVWLRNECTALDLLRRWVRAIEELFNPPRTAEIKAACIQCGEREVWRSRDGQQVRQTALVFVRDRETGESTSARCQACGSAWLPYQFGYLAEKIAENERHADGANELHGCGL